MSSELKEKAESLGIKVDGRWSDARIFEEIEKRLPNVHVDNPYSHNDKPVDDLNNLALRIWNGQSASLSLKDRVHRIVKAAKSRGYDDFSGLSLPAQGFEKYL